MDNIINRKYLFARAGKPEKDKSDSFINYPIDIYYEEPKGEIKCHYAMFNIFGSLLLQKATIAMLNNMWENEERREDIVDGEENE